MNKTNIKILNPIALPLQGSRLIEASAGTGKTFTISLLYLRLLLGLQNQNAYYRPLSVEEILVVTFTEAATNELRQRIRGDIHQLRLSCIRGKSDNNMHQLLLDQIDDPQKAIERLLIAEFNIYNASIYTIHGFCMRVLKAFNYEFNIIFRNVLLTDEYRLLKKITLNFWQSRCCSMSLELGRIISAEWNSADDFLSTIYHVFQKNYIQDITNACCCTENLESKHIDNLARIHDIKKIWKIYHRDILLYINSININKRIYSEKNLKHWIDKITIWSNSITLDYQVPKEIIRFRQSIIQENTMNSDVKHKLFEAIDNFLFKPLSLRNIFITEALIDISNGLKKEKLLQGLVSFDDLLYYLDAALEQPNANILANNIRNYFPVLLIDEFQDINPQQYRIFSKIYSKQTKNALIIIGDPKQSIYSFRGADISTYFNMRHDIKDIYTLDINWRSSTEMTKSVNCLFTQQKLPFISSEITFNPVKSSIKNQSLKFILNEHKYPSMCLWLHPVNNIHLNDFEKDIAKQCAFDIHQWIAASNQKKAYLMKNNDLQALRPSDIAILVRNRREANLIHSALKLFNISSCYLSDLGSVYNTIEARELFYLLKAIQYPKEKQLIRTALATSIFSIGLDYIESLSNDDKKIKIWIDKFSHWKLLWQKNGLLPMLHIIISQYITENIVASHDGNLRFTNLMHLGELLQTQYVISTGPNQLLNFFLKQIANSDNQSIDQQIRLTEDTNIIRIITIHKSKGLQYPIVWLPFALNFAVNNKNHYFDDIPINQENKEYIINEDLRLLYVAVTRSIYHCSIGISTFVKGLKNNSNDLYKSALGYLLECNHNTNLQTLMDYIHKLHCIDIKLIDVKLKNR
ncbi:exodeoxyribonuclease V subunit beta [Candidatus Pantoea edessiphila]|uniref:exodeoxyribonuclease V subunit beta n=1 Tax=Candidatus Pantoea edessiphila TaxID=2044610 RepID=UPI001319CA1B|nr:exodeoxyribonuclease V subunit beta [Candidatus Pantoea edessiphila]